MPFSLLPQDILLEVMGWCGPRDLQQLRLVRNLFHEMLTANQHIWRLSRANVGMNFPLPAAAGTEPSFATFIFDSGPCTVCSRTTADLPYSFSLSIRICSAACSLYLLKIAPLKIAPDDIDEHLPHVVHVIRTSIGLDETGLPLLASLPYLEGTTKSRLYLPSSIHDALNDLDAVSNSPAHWTNLFFTLQDRTDALPAFMQMAETLQAAVSKNRPKQREIEKSNRIFVAILASENQLTYDQLITSPTLLHHLNAFARDLTIFSYSAWGTIHGICLKEVAHRMLPSNRCSFCIDRTFTTKRNLEEHIQVQHPEQCVAIASERHRCTLCPPSSRDFRLESLKRHIDSRHRKVREDLGNL
ncbi:hypothetical protein C8R43DRAFT_1134966 [Mycena crocata]|nr:hypothetical protein C8R43DRAFT_1134966 [Mycena crocata]